MKLAVSQTPSNTPSNTPTLTPSNTSCPTFEYYANIKLYECNYGQTFTGLPLTGWTLEHSGISYTNVQYWINQQAATWCQVPVQAPFIGASYIFELTTLSPGWTLCSQQQPPYNVLWDSFEVVLTSFIGRTCITPSECISDYSGEIRLYLNGVLQSISLETFQFVEYLVSETENCPPVYLMFNPNMGFIVDVIGATPTPSVTATNTQTPSQTQTQTSTIGLTPTATQTQTPSQTQTRTPSITPTQTPSQTQTGTPNATPTATCPIPTLYLANTDLDACNQSNGQFLTNISYTTSGSCDYCDYTTLNSTEIPGLSNGTYYVSDGTRYRAWTKSSTPSVLYDPSECGTCVLPSPTQTSTPPATPTQTATPPETPTQTPTPSTTPPVDDCVCYEYTNDGDPSGVNELSYLDCNGNAQQFTNIPFGESGYFCAIFGSVQETAGLTYIQVDESFCGGCIPTEICAVAEIRTELSLDVTITGVEVNSVPMTYLSGDTFPIAASDPPGYYETSLTGISLTVNISYNPCIAGQRIELVDCNSNTFCCDLNPGGGNCIFEGVDISCGCNFTIAAYDGTC